MKKILLFVFTLGVVLGLSAPPGYSAIITLAPEVDTYVSSGSIGTSYGTNTSLNVGIGPNPPHNRPKYRSYLKFDLSTILDNSTINNATLELYCYYATPGSYNYELHHVANDLGVTNGTTWSNQPGAASAYLDREYISSDSHVGWKSWDLLSVPGAWNFAADLVDGYVSVRLILDPESAHMPNMVAFHSMDYSGTSYDPKLVIDYTPVPIPTTIFLLGSCLIGLAGIRKKLKK